LAIRAKDIYRQTDKIDEEGEEWVEQVEDDQDDLCKQDEHEDDGNGFIEVGQAINMSAQAPTTYHSLRHLQRTPNKRRVWHR
jgi:hypothetical protein